VRQGPTGLHDKSYKKNSASRRQGVETPQPGKKPWDIKKEVNGMGPLKIKKKRRTWERQNEKNPGREAGAGHHVRVTVRREP